MGTNLYKLLKINWYISGPVEFLAQKNQEELYNIYEQSKLLAGRLKDLTQLSELKETAARPTKVSSLYHSSPIVAGALDVGGGFVYPNNQYEPPVKTVAAGQQYESPYSPPEPPPPPSPPSPGISGKTGKTGVLVDVAGVTVSPKNPGRVIEPEPDAKVSKVKVVKTKVVVPKVVKAKVSPYSNVTETKVVKAKVYKEPKIVYPAKNVSPAVKIAKNVSPVKSVKASKAKY